MNLWPPPCEGGALPAELTAPPGEFEFYANTPSESSINFKVKKFLQNIFANLLKLKQNSKNTSKTLVAVPLGEC